MPGSVTVENWRPAWLLICLIPELQTPLSLHIVIIVVIIIIIIITFQ